MLASQKPLLLYVGNEPMLSKASAELLKRVGYRVRTTDPIHALQAVREGRFAAVILCATLSSEEADDVVKAAGDLKPPFPVVSVHLGLLGDGPNPASSVVVDALNGPEALVSAVEHVIGTVRQPRSASKAG